MEREKKRKGYELSMGFPSYSDGKESPCSAGDPGSTLGWEDPLEEGMEPTPAFLPGESHGQRSLVGYSPQGHKVRHD